MSKLFNKRDFLRLIGSAAVAAPTAAVVTKATQKDAAADGRKEPAYERVIRTNTLRCGYALWEPGMSMDPMTGKLTGIYYDFLEAIGQHTGLKMEWVGEIGWGDYPTALNSGRIDVMSFGAWPKANLAREILFSEPTYYLPIYAYVREGDTRFDHTAEKINSSSVVISTMDFGLSSEFARTRFPKAKTFSVPENSAASILLLNVAAGKADVTFTDAWHGDAYMKANPGKLRIVPLEHPLRLFGHTIPVAKGEQSLLALINAATNEIIDSGESEAIIRKYEPTSGVLLMRKEDYQ